MNVFKDNLKDFSIYESKNTLIPPASLHSFLKKDSNFPGIVLAGFEEKFKNKYVYYNNSTR